MLLIICLYDNKILVQNNNKFILRQSMKTLILIFANPYFITGHIQLLPEMNISEWRFFLEKAL